MQAPEAALAVAPTKQAKLVVAPAAATAAAKATAKAAGNAAATLKPAKLRIAIEHWYDACPLPRVYRASLDALACCCFPLAVHSNS